MDPVDTQWIILKTHWRGGVKYGLENIEYYRYTHWKVDLFLKDYTSDLDYLTFKPSSVPAAAEVLDVED